MDFDRICLCNSSLSSCRIQSTCVYRHICKSDALIWSNDACIHLGSTCTSRWHRGIRNGNQVIRHIEYSFLNSGCVWWDQKRIDLFVLTQFDSSVISSKRLSVSHFRSVKSSSRMTKNDVKQYLEKIYKIDVLDVTTLIKQGEIHLSVNTETDTLVV